MDRSNKKISLGLETKQSWYSKQKNFDPRSKLFAFDVEKPVAYISSIKRPTFVPFGFPWALDGYEGEVQHHLFDTVYNYCVEDLKATSFLQRFRQEWTYQTRFFEEKGFMFAEEMSNPIFVCDLSNDIREDCISESCGIKIHTELPVDRFRVLMGKDKHYGPDDLDDDVYYVQNDIDVDWYLEIIKDGKSIGMSCVTSRKDTKYSEIVVTTADYSIEGAFDFVMGSTLYQLSTEGVEYASMTLGENSDMVDLVKEHNFEKTSRSVFYKKEL